MITSFDIKPNDINDFRLDMWCRMASHAIQRTKTPTAHEHNHNQTAFYSGSRCIRVFGYLLVSGFHYFACTKSVNGRAWVLRVS